MVDNPMVIVRPPKDRVVGPDPFQTAFLGGDPNIS